MKNVVILYHAHCPDGFGAAWAARKKFKERAEYIPVQHNTPLPEGLSGKEIYILDFCYPKEVMEELLSKNKKVVAIDHHISQKAIITALPFYVFDLDHSGAVLAWKYFHHGKRTPKLLRHIEDIDLWSFKLPHTREIILALRMRGYDFKIWDRIAPCLEETKKRRQYVKEGTILLAFQRTILEDLAVRADKVIFEGFPALAVNSSVFNSELGNLLVKKGVPIGIVWRVQNNKTIVSLRSDGKTDVCAPAQKYGGGGHKAASSFTLAKGTPLPWKIKQ